jgi:ribosome-associated toxin RatA of RatAB toxin-antitoxin module
VKEIQGRARDALDVPAEDCFELVAAVEDYPDWFEFVSVVQMLEAELDGTPGLARATLHVPQSPFGQDFELLISVRTEPPWTVTLTRVPRDAGDEDRLEVIWRVDGEDFTELELEFDAAASFVPAFFPLGDVGDAIARAAIDAARAALAR